MRSDEFNYSESKMHTTNEVSLFFFQNVIFYVLSDDIRKAKAKLTNANFNSRYNLVYVGNGYSTIPGTNIENFS